jgi:hypothetical protein
MNRARFCWAVAMGLALLGPSIPASAQTSPFTGVDIDPFSLYFGYYLPHQAYVAAQPRPMDTINAITTERQMNAMTDRAGLYDPVSPYGQEENDPFQPYGSKKGHGEHMGPLRSFVTSANVAGRGPAQFYGRTERYFPQIRGGQGPNKNLAVHRPHRGFSGGTGGGMGGMGMPGFR